MEGIAFDIVIIVVSAALLAWLGSVLRQPIIIAYIVAGMIIGPYGLGIVKEIEVINALSHIGITLLLFLAGLVLHPDRLMKLFGKTMFVTLGNCVISALLVLLLLKVSGYTMMESLFAGVALMFTSTILVIRLLPTTRLHQQYMGSFCIAILIAEDIIAVVALMFIKGQMADSAVLAWLMLLSKGVFLVGLLVAVEQILLRRMMRICDRYHEVLYMLAMAWCLGVAAFAHWLGLSYEVGAFAGGVILARSPVSRFLTEKLLPMRDFFLMFFFFVLGAKFNISITRSVWVSALLTAIIVVASKPYIFQSLFKAVGEGHDFARESGFRLGQSSEFGLIIAIAAADAAYITVELSQLIQLTVIISIMLSSYLVVFKYPTPIGTTAGLQQD